MTQQCNRYRFWLADLTSCNFDDEPHAYGRCRRYPPTISDHMAAIAIGTPTFGQQFDPEDLADSISVHRSGLHPATFCNDWCGEFSFVADADDASANCSFVIKAEGKA